MGLLLALLSAAFGLAVSLVLASVGPSGLCPDGGGCDAVLRSTHAHLFGVPLAYLGVLYYVAVAFLAFWWCATGSRLGRCGVVILGFAGAAVSAYLLGVQVFAVRAFCPWCLASAAATVGVLAGGWRGTHGVPRPGAVAGLGALAIVGLVIAVLYRPRADPVLARFDGATIRASDLERDDPKLSAEVGKAEYVARATYVRRKFASMAISAEAERQHVAPEALTKEQVDDVVEKRRPELEAKARELTSDDDARRQEMLATLLDEARSERRAAWVAGLLKSHQATSLVRPPEGRKIDVDPSLAHRLGPDHAKVDVTVFADLQCAVCAQLESALEAIRGESPDVSVSFVHFPLRGHDFSEEAAIVGEGVARERGDAAFFVYVRTLYEDVTKVDSARIAQAAQQQGVSPEQSEAFRKDPALVARVQKSAAFARAAHLEGAPEVLINGRLIEGTLDLATLRARIAAARG